MQKENLSQRTAETLQQMILQEHIYKYGEKLPNENELSAKLGDVYKRQRREYDAGLKRVLEMRYYFSGEGCGYHQKPVSYTHLNTIIVDGAGDKEAIKSRVAQIKSQIEVTTSEFDKEKLCLLYTSSILA